MIDIQSGNSCSKRKRKEHEVQNKDTPAIHRKYSEFQSQFSEVITLWSSDDTNSINTDDI